MSALSITESVFSLLLMRCFVCSPHSQVGFLQFPPQSTNMLHRFISVSKLPISVHEGLEGKQVRVELVQSGVGH